MAHEVENLISTKGIVPWHRIGVVTPKELITAEDIITAIGFDFKVKKRQNQTFIHIDGKRCMTPLADSFSTIRINADKTESVLCGRVGKNYTPIQNVDAFGFFDNVVGKGEAIYETAGILRNGRTVFLLAVLPEYIKILGSDEDKIKQFVLLANWHDGTSALIALFTDVRVVCNNTLNMALSSAQSQVSIRHTASAEEKMREASRTMGMVNQYNVEIAKAFNSMAVARMSADDLVAYVKTLIPMPVEPTDVVRKRVQEHQNMVLELAEVGHGATLGTAKGTVWGSYNAYVEYIDHGSSFRSDDSRALSLLVGAGRTAKQTAFDLGMKYAERNKPLSNVSMN
jgi:phage/plasmid-like protein (TIGR03299 family)